MKKLLLVLLTVFSFNAIHAEITWELSSDGTLIISGTDMPNYSETNPVPWKNRVVKNVVIEDGVTNIGDQAFRSCMSVTSVSIPKSVTSIGMMAFNWCGMTMIEIPSSVTEIKEGAFSCCTNLTSITIPKSVTSIGELAFDCCHSLSSIVVEEENTKYDSRNNCNAIIETNSNILIQGCKNTVIPNNVTSIGNYAFDGYSDIKSIDIPKSVTSIGKKAFENTGLTSLTLPKSVTSLGEDAFLGCNYLNSIVVEEGNTIYDSRNKCNAIIETKSNTLILGCKNTVIPDDVTCIGNSAFYGSSDLTAITIPNSVTSIEDKAFSDCSSLTSITIPKSVTNIGDCVFCGCGNLASIIVEEGNTKYDSRNNCNAIIETNTNTLIQGCKNTVIPNNVTSIGNDAFYCCSGITSIDIPNSVTSIGDRAFYVCDKLTSVVIPNSVTSIGEEAFYYCNAFESIVLPESVKSVGKKAFRTCNNLTNLTISNSEMSIADDAFEECWMLLNVTILSKNPPAFTNVTFPSYTTFHVPAGSKAAYETAEFWKNFNIVEDVTTGIDSVAAPAIISEDKIFSISGQRLDKAAKGVNIIKGKKVLVK